MLHAILELDRSLVYIYFPPSLLPIPIHPRPSFPTPAISLHLLFPSFSHFVNQLSRSSAEGTTRREEKQDVDSLVGAAFTVSFLSTLFSLSSLTFSFSFLLFSFSHFFLPFFLSSCLSPAAAARVRVDTRPTIFIATWSYLLTSLDAASIYSDL